MKDLHTHKRDSKNEPWCYICITMVFRLSSENLLICLISILTVYISGYFWSRNKQYSFFYRVDYQKRFVEWPMQRHEDAATALDSLEAYARRHRLSLPLFSQVGGDPTRPADLCVAILTTTRRDRHGKPLERQYLRQTIAALLTRVQIDQKHQSEINMAVYNLDSPDEPSNPDIVRIGRILQVIPPPNYANVTGGRWKVKSDSLPVSFRENVDFLSVLQDQATRRYCKYHLILEDDALACHEWYEHLKRALGSIPRERPWHYLKFFVSLGWFGWSWQLDWILELLLIGSVVIGFGGIWMLGAIISGITDVFHMRKSPFRRWIWGMPLWIHLMILASGIGVAWMIGRQNLHYALPGIYPSPTYVFMVAVVYPREEVGLFADYIQHNLHPSMPIKDNHYPHYVADLIRRGVIPRERDTWIVSPDFFQHIGHHSSLHKDKYEISKMRYSTSFTDDQARIVFREFE